MLARPFLASLILSIFMAEPALALSCAPYSAQQAFLDASNAPEPYIIAHGQLEFNPGDLPDVDWEHQEATPQDTFLNASLTGFSLTGSGFNARFVRQIRVNVQCYGPWCASLRPGIEYLVFLKKEGGEYLLEVNPCSGYAFWEPSQDTLDDIHQCLLGESCEPEEF